MLFLLIISCWMSPPQDQAERLYDNAITFMNAGKYKEALADFETIVTSFGNTPWASLTLLKLSTYYLEVEQDSSKALIYLNQIQSSHASAPEAPAAYYYKALITSRNASTQEEVEAASADLVRMFSIFPQNPWRGDALFLMGKVCMQLGNFKQGLSYFQRLEFSEPTSPHLQQAWLLSAQAAYASDLPDQAVLILSRLQARFPNSLEAQTASAWLRLLTRISASGSPYQLDKTFVGAAPKTFTSPELLLVSKEEVLAVANGKNLRLLPLANTGQSRDTNLADLQNLARGPQGELLLVFDNRVTSEDGSISFKNLSLNGSALKDLKSAAIDQFGRLYVVDGDAKDVFVFDRNGTLLKTIGQAKAKLVASFANELVVLQSDGNTLRRFDRTIQPTSASLPLKNVIDIRFDDFGNLFVLHEKGALVTVVDRNGKQLASINLKNGAYPLKQAEALAVDASGAIYLADRRAGAVFRFL